MRRLTLAVLSQVLSFQGKPKARNNLSASRFSPLVGVMSKIRQSRGLLLLHAPCEIVQVSAWSATSWFQRQPLARSRLWSFRWPPLAAPERVPVPQRQPLAHAYRKTSRRPPWAAHRMCTRSKGRCWLEPPRKDGQVPPAPLAAS